MERAFARVAGEPVFAVISDVHANLEALRAALAFLDARGVSSIVCLGDIVGYGPQPCECIELLRARGIPCLRGNHDTYAIAATVPGSISPDATTGIHFARAVLRPVDLDFLRGLPVSCTTATMAFVHASFPQPEAWCYVGYTIAATEHLAAQPRPVSFFGHTHVPEVFFGTGDETRRVAPSGTVPLTQDGRAAFNPGAVGQPRDEDPRASLLICEPAPSIVHFHRVAYDVEATAAALRHAGLPDRLGHRLRRGW